jgi:hypothetical protein
MLPSLRIGGLIVMSVLCCSSLSQAEGKNCSLATSNGDWAFTYTGTIILPTGPVPVASSGRFTAKDGNMSGTQTRSLGGQVADETLTGTYIVNSDCTEVLNANVFFQGTLVRTAVLKVIYDNNGRAARGIFMSLALADGTALPSVITVDAARIFP